MDTVAPPAGLPSAPKMRPPMAEVVFCAKVGAADNAMDKASASLVS
jgi:hypothetical protein